MSGGNGGGWEEMGTGPPLIESLNVIAGGGVVAGGQSTERGGVGKILKNNVIRQTHERL
jgi:hypothetical protein